MRDTRIPKKIGFYSKKDNGDERNKEVGGLGDFHRRKPVKAPWTTLKMDKDKEWKVNP